MGKAAESEDLAAAFDTSKLSIMLGTQQRGRVNLTRPGGVFAEAGSIRYRHDW
jgi:hypothetical protein